MTEHIKKGINMRHIGLVLKCVVVCLALIAANGFTFDQNLPVIDGEPTVATVNNEPITLEAFNRAIAASHREKSGKGTAGRIDFSAIMNRIINTKLIILEAKNIGLDELPKTKDTVENFSRQNLMELLIDEHLKAVKADENEVERLYRESIKEWKIKTVQFEKKGDVEKFEKELKAGRDFDDLIKEALKTGTAGAVEEGKYFKSGDLSTPIARQVSQMDAGSVSPIFSMGKKGFIIFKVEGIRFPDEENVDARRKAKAKALYLKKEQAAKAYYEDLRKRYVRVDEKLFDSLDYESQEPGMKKLLRDERVVAKVKGAQAVTVGELSRTLEQKFFHGIERAIESKQINRKKAEVLEGLLQRRILLTEALRKGLDRTEIHRDRVKAYEESVIFGAFINKAIAPDIKLSEKDLKEYYQENKEEYSSPEMMRIRSLVFQKRTQAVDALERLKSGAHFAWMLSHADGQVKIDTGGLLHFEDRPLMVKSLPEGIQKAVSGARPGNLRLYESPEGFFYVLYIEQVVSPSPKPFESVKKEIEKIVFNEKVKEAVQNWADQLRAYYPVEIYGIGLEK